MSTTITSDYGWFYNIIQAQTLVLGYGITSRYDPWERLIEYSRPVAAPQTFCNLYFGKMSEIRTLERYVKSEWGSYRMDIFSNEKLEWLDPKHKINLVDLEMFVSDFILSYPLETVRIVKKHFMPFTVHNSGLFSNIITEPDRFLEEVKLAKKSKG